MAHLDHEIGLRRVGQRKIRDRQILWSIEKDSFGVHFDPPPVRAQRWFTGRFPLYAAVCTSVSLNLHTYVST